MNATYYALPILIIAFFQLSAQSIDRSAITPAGDRYSNPATGQLDWAIGEIGVETFAPSNILTLGFLQGNLSISGPVSTPPEFEGEVSFFPNPTDGSVTIRFTQARKYQLSIFDPLGKPLFNERVIAPDHHIDLGPFANGVYEVKIIDENGAFLTTRIVKVTNR